MAYYPTEDDDTIFVTIPNEEINALGGDDHVTAFRFGARIFGGSGDDWLSSSVDEVASADGTLSAELNGQTGDDHLFAALALEGDEGDYHANTLEARLSGGQGDDVLWAELGAGDALINAALDGGGGDDTLTLSAQSIAGAYGPSLGNIALSGGAGADLIRVSISLGENLLGASPGMALVRGGDGADRITSRIEIADESGGTSRNELHGDGGDDVIVGRAIGTETGFGGAEINHAWGGTGADRITLEAIGYNTYDHLENTARGEDGDDVLSARATLPGDSGEVSNTLDGGAGNDSLAARIDVAYDGVGLQAVNRLSGGAGDDTLTARITFGADPFDARAHSELRGGGGDDLLSVRGGGHNLLSGGSGADTLLGGEGVDSLAGGAGDDWLRGRGGADVFRFDHIGAGERDRVADFTIGEDRIDLSRIDANLARGGDQSFIFGTSAGAGRVWITEGGDSASVLHANDGAHELTVVLSDGRGQEPDHYRASDFLL